MTITKHWTDDRSYELSTDNEVRMVSATGGEKGAKPAKLGAIDPLALLELAKVAGYGAEKYSAFNYLKGYDWSLSFDAMQRHVLAFWNGEDIDVESGLPHVTHAAWHGLCLTSFLLRDLGTDDRFRPMTDETLPFDWDAPALSELLTQVLETRDVVADDGDGIESDLQLLSDFVGVPIHLDNSVPVGLLRVERPDGTITDIDFDEFVADRVQQMEDEDRESVAALLEEAVNDLRDDGTVAAYDDGAPIALYELADYFGYSISPRGDDAE